MVGWTDYGNWKVVGTNRWNIVQQYFRSSFDPRFVLSRSKVPFYYFHQQRPMGKKIVGNMARGEKVQKRVEAQVKLEQSWPKIAGKAPACAKRCTCFVPNHAPIRQLQEAHGHSPVTQLCCELWIIMNRLHSTQKLPQRFKKNFAFVFAFIKFTYQLITGKDQEVTGSFGTEKKQEHISTDFSR